MISDLRRTRLGLLRRLNKNFEAFKYVELELSKVADKEQFKYDFDDVFNSSEYKEFKKRDA